jgi:Cytochrome c554 and c-prime
MSSRFHSAILLALLAAAASLHSQSSPKHPAPAPAYVGTAACSRCHLGIANTFAKASMGHSLTRITPDFLKTLPIVPGDQSSFTDPKINHTFTVHADNGKLFQTESEASPEGQEIFSNTHEMDWIIGTGENGFGALLNRDGFLFQAPLSYYSKPAAWRLSPTYEVANQSFNRIIVPACLSCHSGRPRPVPNLVGKYESTSFSQISVGCENCHGPGSAHVEARGRGEEPSKPGKADPTIVNPARLTAQLSNEICMSCHQLGDARVLRQGKTFQDYRPGESLDHTYSIFQISPTHENPPQEDHLEHYFSMSLSKCFRATQGKPDSLRCISCHDPHVEPTGAEAPAYFNSKCMSCHTAQTCTAPQAARQQTTPVADNCISCHMPRRNLPMRDMRFISHSTLTNHRVVRTADEPFPDETFAQEAPAMPGLIHLNPDGKRGVQSDIPSALVRLQAYDDLMRTREQFVDPWRKLLGELEVSSPQEAIVQAAAGHRDLRDGKLPEAIAHLSEALRLDPSLTETWSYLSEAQFQADQAEPAVVSAKRAVELAPYAPALQKALIYRLINAKHFEEAQAALEKYIATFPEDDFMRKALAMAKSQ